MKGVIIHKTNEVQNKALPFRLFLDFFILPFKSGLFGFAAFFTILILTKMAAYFIGYADLFRVNTEDVTLSFLGFALLFIVRLAQNIKKII